MTRRYYYRPWKDESLVSALHFMRCRAVRDDDLGLEHVDALLRQLGVEPEALQMPRKIVKRFKRGELRRAICVALRDGPLTGAQITDMVSGDMAYDDVYKRVYGALDQMKAAGLVKREGRLWLGLYL